MKPNETAQLIPIQELTSDIIRINLPLPEFLEKGQIGIDVIRLEILCRVAGIKELHIRTMKAKERNRTKVIMTGRNADGTATGSFINEGDVSQSSQQNYNPDIAKLFSQINAEINIDMDEFIRNIATKYPNGVRSIEGWCEELEKIIMQHIKKEGLKHLLSGRKFNASIDAQIVLPITLYYCIWTFALWVSEKDGAQLPKIVYLIAGIAARLLTEIKVKIRLGEGRISPLAIAGIEWDRALFFLGIILATRNAVGIIPKT